MTTAYEKVKKWRVANPEKWKKARRESNLRNPETVRARRKRYYAKHPGVIKAERDKRKHDIRCFIEEIKASSGCVFCGENFPAALDFHHTGGNGDKEINISQIAIRSWGLERVRKEMAKCVLLCANCHRKLHAGFLSLCD